MSQRFENLQATALVIAARLVCEGEGKMGAVAAAKAIGQIARILVLSCQERPPEKPFSLPWLVERGINRNFGVIRRAPDHVLHELCTRLLDRKSEIRIVQQWLQTQMRNAPSCSSLGRFQNALLAKAAAPTIDASN